MNQQAVLLTMLGMLVVTYLPRLLPMLLFSNRDLPPLVVSWLRFVPAAVLSAMLLPSLVLIDNRLNLQVDNIFLWAAVPTFIVALKTKSLFGSVIVGMIVVAAARFFVT
jgi:branched-subunit amino acid transport protein